MRNPDVPSAEPRRHDNADLAAGGDAVLDHPKDHANQPILRAASAAFNLRLVQRFNLGVQRVQTAFNVPQHCYRGNKVRGVVMLAHATV